MAAEPIHAVLFDLDGTLVDHEAAAREAVTASFLARFAVPAAEQDRLVVRWQELESSAMERYLAGELTFGEQRRVRVTQLAADFGFGARSDEEADAWFAEYLGHYEAGWRPYPDAAPALISLADKHPELKLGVITNGDADQQRHKLHRIGLTDLLPTVIASSEAGAAKPDVRIFHAACAALRLQPSQIVYVGDRLHTDAEAAVSAGLHGVWLDRQHSSTAASTPRITTLADLDALFSAPLPAPLPALLSGLVADE
ncbi:HAD family hydrolase [Catenulispora pinisilvae]|uniref:HAD family hydrolase n=1 Tax=Catenulispora pinisilvae TaxID=2705253 RepID=UPI0018916C98|nr:HAD family hydrolase [Catenulispora pinisilvae]